MNSNKQNKYSVLLHKLVTILIFAPLLLCACFEAETPVKPYPRGDAKVKVIEMGPDYEEQYFFRFETNSIISQSSRDKWDLAFQSYGDDHFIILNGAKVMEAADMGNLDFESVKDRSQAVFKYDSTNGNYEDYAIGKWWETNNDSIFSKNHVYIINRGRDIGGKRIGYVKMQILSADRQGYKIRFSDMDGENEFFRQIPRNSNFNYMMFSFDDGGTIYEIEPNRHEWDIKFTRFLAFLPYNNSLLPYSVTGVLINHTLTEASADSIKPFNQITLEDIDNYTFSESPGFIGHEWKNFELNGEVYTAKDYITYIMKDVRGFYWKFRFIDFYNDDRQRGYPKFEFIKL